MNHVSIFEKKWLDLVFEGKNKSYGAYQLRLQNPRTTLMALLFGLLILASVVGIGLLSAKLGTQQVALTDIPIDEPITPVDLWQPPVEPAPQAVTAVTNNEEPEEDTRQLDDPEIVAAGNETDVILTNKPVAPETPPGPGISGTNPTPAIPGGGEKQPTGTTTAGGNNPVPTAILDKMPMYPGGLENFYKYVGKNFDKPEIDNVKSVTVIVLFVIEKDGSISDVRVARDPGYGMAKEALRVLKNSKVKWTPGYKDGQPVRTAYTLPITVNVQ